MYQDNLNGKYSIVHSAFADVKSSIDESRFKSEFVLFILCSIIICSTVI